MRCPDCARLVGYAEPEVEVTDDIQYDNGCLIGSIRVWLPCADCGAELKESIFDVDLDLSEWECTQAEDTDSHDITSPMDIEPDVVSLYDDISPKTGKRIKQGILRHGAEFNTVLDCSCGQKYEVSWHDTVDQRSFDEV